MLKTIRWTAIGLIAVLAVVWGAMLLGERNPGSRVARTLAGLGLSRATLAPGVGEPFTLVDTSGATVTDATYRGRWMLVYFGYTYCPDICPTELQTIASALDLLGPTAKRIAPIFITIDPARDTPAKLGQYIGLFDDRLIGLTGSADQIAAVAKAYRVYYARVGDAKSGSYVMDHSSLVYLLSPSGAFRAMMPNDADPSALADAIRSEIGQSE